MNSSKVSYAATGNNIEERLENTQRTLVALFLFLVILPFFWGLVKDAQNSIIKRIEITNMELITPSEVCPGDKLVFTYDLKVRGEGKLILDMTVWRVEPPKTIIFSDNRRFILGSALEHSLQETWLVPNSFFNYDIGEVEEIPPGLYRRYISISSPSLSNIQDTHYVDFTVREDC